MALPGNQQKPAGDDVTAQDNRLGLAIDRQRKYAGLPGLAEGIPSAPRDITIHVMCRGGLGTSDYI